MSDPISDAMQGGDAFSGGGTAPIDSAGNLPGFGLNNAVPGAYASPVGDNPSVFHGDGLEMAANASSGTTDGFATAMNPTSMASYTSANNTLGPGMLTNARAAIGSAGASSGSTQGPAPLGPDGQDAPPQGSQPPGAPATPPPAVIGGSGGFLTAQVQHADDNLIGMLQSAASGAGGVTAKFASTVTLSSGGVSAGGSGVQGQHNSLGPYTIYKDTSWFGPTIEQWQQIPPPPAAGSPPPDGGGPSQSPGSAGPGSAGPGSGGSDGAQVGQSAVTGAVDKSLGSFGDGGAGGGGEPGGDTVPESADPSQQQADSGTGFNDSVWSGIGGLETVGQAEAIPQGFNDEGVPLGSLRAFGDNTPDATNTPQQWDAIQDAKLFHGAFSSEAHSEEAAAEM